jgi:4'-phosphopantetheinyl transferase
MQDSAVDVSVYLLAPVPTAPSLAVLTPGELRRAEALSTEETRRGFRAAHTLLRLAVADHLAVPPTELTFDFTCSRCGEHHGPPRILAGPGAGTALSLTRSSGLIAVALLASEAAHRNVRVGVDIERVDAVGFEGFDGVALSPGERTALGGAPGSTPARAALWARKEAVAKALGSGLRRDPREIDVLGVSGCDNGEAVVDGQSVAWCDVHLDRGGFAAAVAVSGRAPGTGIRVTLNDAATLFARYLTTPTTAPRS